MINGTAIEQELSRGDRRREISRSIMIATVHSKYNGADQIVASSAKASAVLDSKDFEFSGRCRTAIRELHVAHTPPQGSGGLPQSHQSASDRPRVKVDLLFAVGTGDITITLEPAERFIEPVATVRARKTVLDVSA